LAKLLLFCSDSWPGADLAEALPLFIELMEKDPTDEVWDGILRSRRKTPAFMREDTSRAARRQSPFPMLLLLTFYAHSGIFVPALYIQVGKPITSPVRNPIAEARGLLQHFS
jgi:hypothetical protein